MRAYWYDFTVIFYNVTNSIHFPIFICRKSIAVQRIVYDGPSSWPIDFDLGDSEQPWDRQTFRLFVISESPVPIRESPVVDRLLQ